MEGPMNYEEQTMIAGTVVGRLVSMSPDDGGWIGNRLSVQDLWTIASLVIEVASELGTNLHFKVPADLSSDERKVWLDATVREELKNGRKIQAIKQARSLTMMSLKEAKDIVERMQREGGL